MKNEIEIRLKNLSDDLVRKSADLSGSVGTPEFENCQRLYFLALLDWRCAKKQLMDEIECSKRKPKEVVKTDYAIDLENKRAIKEASVTSATYERSKKRLFNNVNGFLCGN